MTSDTKPEMLQMETSDVDRWIGVPLGGQQFKEPFSTNDIRRFVQGVQNPNPLYYDEEYAEQSHFGRIVAPQSYFGGGPGTGATPSIQGTVPGSHMLFGGDEFWFFGTRIFPGDKLQMERMLYDYRVTNTSFAGPTMFSRGDTVYYNQNGDSIARQRSTSIRYLAENARRLGAFDHLREDPEWADEDLEGIELEKIRYIKSYLGHTKRLHATARVGEKLPRRVIGPHSIQTFVTESRTDVGGWGAYKQEGGPSSTMEAGWLPEMSRNEERMEINPGAGDGLVYGPSRGHVQPRWARVIGMPRGYGYGATMGAWINDYLTNWAGEWGFLVHVNSQYRNPAFTGDVTYQDGEVTGKYVDPQGRLIVNVSHTMSNQLGATLAKGTAEIQLPGE
ncbi:MAG: FAS1-like dehydratase domain-containing protein [Dehalococcoidia bacterium]